MPFLWDIARYCLELPYGAWRHFPSGTYDAQVSTWAGSKELDLVSTVHNAWYIFKHTKPGDWGEDERRFVSWVAREPKPQPTRRVDFRIEMLWGISYWVIAMIEKMRGRDE